MKPTVLVEDGHGPGGLRFLHVQMRAPRAGALEPGLISALHGALDRVETEGHERVLISSGPNFSTGGDVAQFLEAVQLGEGAAYAKRLVPGLQDLVLRLISLPAIVAVAARGAITGGAAGLLFAADLAVLHPQAFVQPYYARMGFAPDGGWTATLPERIGAGASLSWLLSDRRVGAEDARGMGLAVEVSDSPETRAAALLAQSDIATALASKALIWDSARRASVAARLAVEAEHFSRLIGRAETRARMESFLNFGASADV